MIPWLSIVTCWISAQGIGTVQPPPLRSVTPVKAETHRNKTRRLLLLHNISDADTPLDISVHRDCFRWRLLCRVRREKVSPTTWQTPRSQCLRGVAQTCFCWPHTFLLEICRASDCGTTTLEHTLHGTAQRANLMIETKLSVSLCCCYNVSR